MNKTIPNKDYLQPMHRKNATRVRKQVIPNDFSMIFVNVKSIDTVYAWMETSRSMRGMTLEKAQKNGYLLYEFGSHSFGGQYYNLKFALRTTKLRITID